MDVAVRQEELAGAVGPPRWRRGWRPRSSRPRRAFSAIRALTSFFTSATGGRGPERARVLHLHSDAHLPHHGRREPLDGHRPGGRELWCHRLPGTARALGEPGGCRSHRRHRRERVSGNHSRRRRDLVSSPPHRPDRGARVRRHQRRVLVVRSQRAVGGFPEHQHGGEPRGEVHQRRTDLRGRRWWFAAAADPEDPRRSEQRQRRLRGQRHRGYRTTDGGASWSRFGNGLPFADFSDLYLAQDGSFLRASSYGRGVWEIPLN